MSLANAPADVAHAEVVRLFELQRRSQWTVRRSTAAERKERLARLRDALLAHADEAAEAMAADMGRPLQDNEVLYPIAKIDIMIANVDEWMKPTVVTDLHQAKSALVRYEPRGVVLLFGPWNFPISLLFEPLAAIISAGNTAIVKPNELTPAASAFSAKIIREVFDESEVAVVEGGTDVAEALLEQPFDHIFLTGSPRVGRTVMAAAAKNLSTVTLELGGKCPAILDGETDLVRAAQTIAMAKLGNNGQICLTVDYVLVPSSRRDELVQQIIEQLTAAFYVDGVYQYDRTSRIVNAPNFTRVKGYLDEALAKGARVAFGGSAEPEKLVIEPTILVDVPDDAQVLQQEIFGPLLPVIGYDSEDQLIEHIQKGTKPLAMYIFSDDEEYQERIMASTSSGGVTINGFATHYFEDALPFGGVGDSGMGRYHGLEGFRELSHARSVAVN